jgi:hypothetical protein
MYIYMNIFEFMKCNLPFFKYLYAYLFIGSSFGDISELEQRLFRDLRVQYSK